MPESQWPAVLPTQQAIVLDFVSEALATGITVAINDRAIVIATKGRTAFRLNAKICLYRAINMLILNYGLLNQFHFALRTSTSFFRGYILVHRAYIMEAGRLFRVSRTFLLYSSDYAYRIHADW